MKKRMSKILIVLGLVVVTAGFSGCSKIDHNAVVATVNGQNVLLGEANFYMKFQQAQYEQMYMMYMGEEKIDWSEGSGDGQTIGSSTKESFLETFKKTQIIASHAKDYDIELTEEENIAIAAAADAFLAANSEKTLKAMGADKNSVTAVLKTYTLYNKVSNAMSADVDTNVSDEEAAQKKMSYVFVSTSGATDENGNSAELSDEEKAEKRAVLEEIAAAGAEKFEETVESKELTVSVNTFGKDSDTFAEQVYAAANALSVGELSEIVETDTGYYLMRLDSEFDEEATESKKESIVQERKTEAFNAKYEEWEAADTFELSDAEWKKIKLKDNISIVIPETDADTDTDAGTGEEETEASDESNETQEGDGAE